MFFLSNHPFAFTKDRRISFYSHNTNMLPRKPKISYRYLKSGVEEFHRKYVMVPADKAANNVVVVDGCTTLIL